MDKTNKDVLIRDHASIFQGGGEMGALMRAFDWDKHPLGNPAAWPETLKANIRLILNSGFPMFIWWSEELYMFHNDAYLPALGKKHPEALGNSARVAWSEIWEDIGVVVDNILNSGNPFYADSLKLLLERKGYPEETYWTFSYSPAFDDEGNVNGIFCACNEVTATVLGERRLRSLKDISDKTAQIQTLEEACQQTCDTLSENQEDIPFSMIYLLNGTGTEAKLVGKSGNFADTTAPVTIDLAQVDPEWQLANVLRTGKESLLEIAAPIENSVQESLASDRPEQAVVVPVKRPGQDQVIAFFISGISNMLDYNADYKSFHMLLAAQIATSITSVQAREELARQQAYLQEIFHQAPVGIAIVRGPQYVIDLANPGVCQIWGREPQEVLGKPVVDALPEIADQGIIQLLDSVVNTGQPFVANELPLQLERNGEMETVYLNFLYHPLRDAQGFISGVIAVAIDISEQVKAKHELETMNQQLMLTNADLDNFIYSASHDLKAPISNIEGLMHALVEYMPEELLKDETVKRINELIQSSIARFKRTVIELTDVAKIQREAGDDVTYIHLNDVVNSVKLDFETEIASSDAQIDTDFDPEAVIQYSEKNVRSIVYNLLSNALKYKSPERKPVINIRTEAGLTHVLLEVKDNGLGFDLADESIMFSMFKRLHDHVEGSGVGLFIVKRMVENAGGRIEVESEVNRGSTFRIFFKR